VRGRPGLAGRGRGLIGLDGIEVSVEPSLYAIDPQAIGLARHPAAAERGDQNAAAERAPAAGSGSPAGRAAAGPGRDPILIVCNGPVNGPGV